MGYSKLIALPDGTKVRGSAVDRQTDRTIERDFGLYCYPRWSPEWPHELIDWPDFGVPVDPERAAEQIIRAFEKAKRGLKVETGCWGGRGRTGTVLACWAILAGIKTEEAVAWIRKNYWDEAVETPEQERWIGWFGKKARKGPG